MDDMFLLYFITRLDEIRNLLTLVTTLYIAAVIVLGLIAVMTSDSINFPVDDLKNAPYPKLYILVIAVTLATIIPSKNDAIFILAGSNIMQAVKNDDTKRIAGKSVEVFEKYLDDMLKGGKGDGNAR